MSTTFRSRRLSPKELHTTINDVLSTNSKLSDASKEKMAELYERFRDRVHSALTHQVVDQTAFWIELVGDMMTLCNTFNVPGVEKKEMLLEVINIVIDNEVPVNDRTLLRSFITLTISPAIELAIYFYNTQNIKKCCASIFSCKRT